MTLRLMKLVVGSALLTSLGYAQAGSQPTPSSMMSPATSGIQPEATQPETLNPGNNANIVADPATTGIEPIEPAKPDNAKADDASIEVDPASLLPDLPALPHANATLVGGTLERLDRVRDQVTVSVFGGGQVKALFDPRTKVFRGTKEVTIADLRQGERVYLDTILDGSNVFARSIRLKSEAASGQSQGVVVRYRPNRNDLSIRDGLSPTPVQVSLAPSTKFVQNGHPVAANVLVPGSLVAVTFDSQGNGHGVAREISILALPGTQYTFSGEIVHIDLRRGLLVLNSSTDHKTYEIYLNPSSTPDDNLHPGTMVTAVTNYQDSRYVVRNLTINATAK
ncbi:MAG TPA: hypothetical protein VKQ11_20335 [Candidatus Sulfotelmatobacter sp.]|nr:hypothetical protein [Candidatus Sulfotelmatobacter sp.]